MARTLLPRPLLSLLRAGVFLSLVATAVAAQTEFPFAAGTDSTGRTQAVSDAAGRVLIESPEFPRGLWVEVVDETGQALAGIEVEYQGRADSLVVIWVVDPSGLRQETLQWSRPAGDSLHLTLKAADPAHLPPGLVSIDWRIDPAAEELPMLNPVEGPRLADWGSLTTFLQERWQGRTGRVVVQVDSTALAVGLSHPEAVERLVDYLERRLPVPGEEIASFVQVILAPRTFDRELALLDDSIALTTSYVLVPGSDLEEWVLPRLGRSSGPATLSEAAAVTELILWRRQIVDVSPLVVLTNLERLWLGANQIVDVSPLAALTNLVDLLLVGNEIVDVSPLAALTKLRSLHMWRNEIVDVSPLAALTGLKSLDLGVNEIVDVSPLAALTGLEELGLGSNELVDVSPLAALTGLEWLELGSNELVDVSPLAALTNLAGLELWYNQIVDVSPLVALTNLRLLSLDGNEMVDVRPLASLTRLEELKLSDIGIVDMSPLAALTNLEELFLDGNRIVDVSPLAGLTNLEELFLDGNRIVDVSPLASLTTLEKLYLRDNRIVDVSPLVANTGFGEGSHIDLENNPLGDEAINEQIPALRARGVTVTY